MKLWYLMCDDACTYIVGYGNTPQECLDKIIARTDTKDNIDQNIDHWDCMEFTPDDYNGCLLFY